MISTSIQLTRYRLCNSLLIQLTSDVCLEAEASPRGSLEVENLLPWPRLNVLMPRLGLASPRDYCLGLASVSSVDAVKV